MLSGIFIHAIKMPAGLPSDEQYFWNKEMITDRIRFLKGYNHESEMARKAQYELLLSSTDEDIQRGAARRMASLTALRDLSFVDDYERILELRND